LDERKAHASMVGPPSMRQRRSASGVAIRDERQGPRHAIGYVERQPANSRVTTKPGVLAARELPSPAHRLGPRFLLGPLPGQEAQHLGVPEGTTRRPPVPESERFEPAYLADKPRRPHPVDPGLDPF